MKPSQLPNASPFINAHHDALEQFSHLVSIEGKRCLCLGYDEAQLNDYVLKYGPESVVLLTLWDDHRDNQVSGYDIIVGDIGEKTPFSENHFDFVLTFSVLEHINQLESAFVEIKRVLKPGGFFVSLFGPVWSCNVGHHLYADPGNPLFDFLQWQLPSHLHLLASSGEVVDYYRENGASEAECRTAEEWMFKTNIINRVFFEDYLKLFHKHFYLVASSVMYSEVDQSTFSMLRNRYPDYLDFSTYGGSYLLRNR